MLFDISVSSASGVEAVTKRELGKLGIENAPAVNGRISFKGDEKIVASCNLFLRTANRVFITVTSFKAQTFDELFEGIRAADWKCFLPDDAKIIITAKCVSSRLMAISACQSIAKKAVCENLISAYGKPLKEEGARYKIEVSVYKDIVTVSLDTSGEGLHRRGYRGLVGEAPLKETLAAALIELSVWNPSRPFVDLFCGSGTLPIEAALIATDTPAGINRDFDFLHWKNMDFSVFYDIKETARAKIKDGKDLYISGFDIDEKQIELARTHANLAGVGNVIHLQRADMRDFSNRHKNGVIISNPPYGERLMERREVAALYSDLGKLYAGFPDWCMYILTAADGFERSFGRHADKKRRIYNGKLDCNFYTYLGKKP